MITDNIDDIPKWSIHFPCKPTRDNASNLRERRTVQTKGSYLDEYGKHLPKRQYVSDPVKSKRPVLTEAAFHTVHSRPAPFGSIVQDNGSKWAQSIDISFLAWHGQPGWHSATTFGYTRLAGSSDTDATRCLCTLTISCIMGILEARRLGRIVETR